MPKGCGATFISPAFPPMELKTIPASAALNRRVVASPTERRLAAGLLRWYELPVNRALRTGLCLALLAFAVSPACAADRLVWRGGSERVDADIDGWSLPQLLEQLAEITGWQVFVEPGTRLKQPVSVKFSNLPAGDALGRMLG